MADQRPDYVPRLWTQGSVNRRFQGNPSRVLFWLVVTPTPCLMYGGVLIAGGRVLGYPVLALGLISAAQSAVYAPRAYRARKRR